MIAVFCQDEIDLLYLLISKGCNVPTKDGVIYHTKKERHSFIEIRLKTFQFVRLKR